MAHPGERVVNRTCTYVRADGRYVPAVVAALNGASNVDLRVGHHAGDAAADHANIAEMATRDQTNVWVPGSRWRYA